MTNINTLTEMKNQIEQFLYHEGYFGLDGTTSTWGEFGEGKDLNVFLNSLPQPTINELVKWWDQELTTHYQTRGPLEDIETYCEDNRSWVDGFINELRDCIDNQRERNFETKMKEMGFKGYFDIEDKEDSLKVVNE